MQSTEEVEALEKIIGQLQGAHSELSQLAKKSPGDSVNEFKLRLVNKIIENANDVLGDGYKPFDDFEIFDKDDIPTNSDVTLVLSQYMEQAERYRSDNVIYNGGAWWYQVNGQKSDIRSGPPSKVGRK